MHLLDLPVELLEQIFRDACESRGMKRGLRLRLVNRESLIHTAHPTTAIDEIPCLKTRSTQS